MYNSFPPSPSSSQLAAMGAAVYSNRGEALALCLYRLSNPAYVPRDGGCLRQMTACAAGTPVRDPFLSAPHVMCG